LNDFIFVQNFILFNEQKLGANENETKTENETHKIQYCNYLVGKERKVSGGQDVIKLF
jgi:hypothetical protein